MWLHDPRQLGHPRDGLVAEVPDEPEPTAGPQDTMDLGQRLATAKPVERLADGHGVDRRVGKQDGLRRGGVRGHARQLSLQDRPHLVDWAPPRSRLPPT